MFADNLGAELRQGDICSVSEFPRWTPTSPTLDWGNTPGLMVQAWDKPITWIDGRQLVAVCSYDCDIANPRGRAGVLLAPVMPMPAKAGSNREADILASRASVDGKIGYANLYPVRLTSTHDGEEQLGVVDFSAMSAMMSAQDALSELHGHRHFSLVPAARIEFQTKLGLFLSRSEE